MESDWRTMPLEYLVKDILDRRGVTPFKLGSDFVSVGHRVVSAKLVKDGHVDLSADEPRFVDERTFHKWMGTPLQAGDVILTSEAPLGEVAYLREPVDWCLGQRLFAIRPNGHIHGRFLFYALKSERVRYDLQSRATGTTVQGIRQSELRKVQIPFPGIEEQRAIAHILGALDDKIELNRRTNETLEGIARGLFKSWFVDFDPAHAKAEGLDPGLPENVADLFPDSFEGSDLGEIPKGWEVGTLGGLALKPQYGFTASAKEHKVGPKFIRITDINKRPWIEWPSVPYCEASDDEVEQYRVAFGDILIARMADPGHGAMIEQDVEAVFASYLIRFRPKNQVFARFLQYWLRSDDYWHMVRARGVGTTRASLNAQVLAGFQLVVPSARVLEAFGNAAGALRDKIVANGGESTSLSALRDTLLPGLVSGELRVSDVRRFIPSDA